MNEQLPPVERVIRFRLRATDDEQITCIVCGKGECNYELRTRHVGFCGGTKFHGLHKLCADSLEVDSL